MHRDIRRRLAIPSLFAAALLAGCSGAPGDSTDGAKGNPAGQADALAGAPSDWKAFLAWAERQLTTPLAPVPLPQAANVPAPRWNITRLDERLSDASVRCDWSPPEKLGGILAEIGPFRSDQPGKNIRVIPQVDSKRGEASMIRMRGFEVKCHDVGSLLLEVRIPYGDYVDIKWSLGGEARVPVPDNKQVWPLNVSTDGFPEWEGVLREINLRVEGRGPEPVEIRSIKFLGRESAYPKSVGALPVTLDKARLPTIYAHCPAEIRFPPLIVPDNAKLLIDLAQLGEGSSTRSAPAAAAATPTNGSAAAAWVDFEVLVETEGAAVSIAKQRIEQADRWASLTVPLDSLAGKTAAIAFKCTSEHPGAVAFWGNPTLYSSVADPPIVVIYLIDTLAAGHVNLYGYPHPTMPRLTALAERGAWFANMHCNSPVTVASIPDLMLSMPAERHGVYAYSLAVPDALVTLAEVMQAAGFSTASFVTNVNAGPRQNLDHGFDYFVDRIAYVWNQEADRTIPLDEVMTWMKRHADRPVFIYIHTAEPHAPYTPPPGFAGRFDADYTGPVDGTMDARRGFESARTPRDVQHVVALYDEEVLYADHRLGLFLDALETGGFSQRTTLFVTADHGEEFREHGNWGHGPGLYEEVLRTPLVVAGPAVTARGRQDTPAQMYDIMPTVLDSAALPSPYPLIGASLWPLLSGGPPPARSQIEAAPGFSPLSPDRTIITSHHRYIGQGFVEYAMNEGSRWKLVFRYNPIDPQASEPLRFQLFDLQADPGEKENLIWKQPDVGRRLLSRLLAYQRTQPEYDRKAASVKFDAEQLRELKSLGYIGND
jgi:arylsulfatase A-like enzyme